MKNQSKLVAGLIALLAAIFAAAVLSSCASMGTVTYQGVGFPALLFVGLCLLVFSTIPDSKRQ